MGLENINQLSPTASKVIPSPLPAGGLRMSMKPECMYGLVKAGCFRKGSFIPKEMSPFLSLEKSPDLLHPGSYLPEEAAVSRKRAKQRESRSRNNPLTYGAWNLPRC